MRPVLDPRSKALMNKNDSIGNEFIIRQHFLSNTTTLVHIPCTCKDSSGHMDMRHKQCRMRKK